MESTLFVSETAEDIPAGAEDVFVIEDELSEVTDEEYEPVFDVLATLSLEDELSIPLYQMMWKEFVVMSSVDTPLIQQLLIAARLRDRIKESEAKQVRPVSVSERYLPVIKDVAQDSNVSVRHQSTASSDRRLLVTRAILAPIVFFLDRLLSGVMEPFVDTPDKIKTLVVPTLGRFHTISDLLGEFSFDYTVGITPMTVAWSLNKSEYPELATHSPITLSLLAGGSGIVSELKKFFLDIIPLFAKKEYDRQLSAEIEKQLGISAQRTVQQAVDEVVRPSLFRSLCYYQLTKTVIDRYGCEALVVNSGSRTGEAIIAAGRDHQLRRFHVPHSTVSGNTSQPSFGATMFVGNDFAIDYLNSRDCVTDMSKFVNSGLASPSLSARGETEATEVDLPVKLVIATQPYSTDVRQSFVESVLAAEEALECSSEIIIKTHPAEDPEFYAQYTDREDVTVLNDALNEILREADIVVNISSTVGLEAIINDAACICLNEESPLIQNEPYVEQGPVPAFDSRFELEEYFENLTLSKIRETKREQQAFLKAQVDTDGSPAERIADYIRQAVAP